MNLIGLLDQPSSGRYSLLDQDVTLLSSDLVQSIETSLLGLYFSLFYYYLSSRLWIMLGCRCNIEMSQRKK